MAENTHRKNIHRGIALSFDPKHLGLRATALATAFAFLLTTIFSNSAWAQAGVETAFASNAETAQAGWRLGTAPLRVQESPLSNLPQAFGVVRAYQSSAEKNTPFILHIQDAHSNPSAQKNIAKILQWISDQSQSAPPIIALEGVKGTLHPEYLNFFPGHPKVNQALVKNLVNQGELTGTELFAWKKIQGKGEREKVEGRRWLVGGESAISHDSLSTIHYPRFVGRNHNQRISSYSQEREVPVFVGVEEPALYRENLGIYREFLDHETEIKTNLDTLRRELYQRENNILSKEAREYLREKRRRKEGDYESGQRPAVSVQKQETPQWAAYLAYLKKELNEKVKLDLEAPFEQIRFPNVVRLDVLMRAFKDLNIEQAVKEKESFLNELEKKVRAAQDKQTVKAFKEPAGGKDLRERAEQLWALALSYRMDPKAAAQFWKMTGRDILQAELDVAGLDQEMTQLEGWLEDSLAGSDEAKKVFKLGHDFDLLEKTLSLELNSKQVEGRGSKIEGEKTEGKGKWEKGSARKDLADLSFGGKGANSEPLFQAMFDLLSDESLSSSTLRESRDRDVAASVGSLSSSRRRGSESTDSRIRGNDKTSDDIKNVLIPWIRKANRFYELATQRDQILLDNTLKAAQDNKAAVLITGGFHTAGLTSLMQERGIGYAVIQPNMDATGEDLYRKVLREENADVSAYFEKPDMNRQEALFFKSIVENGAAELWEKDKVSHQEIAAETAEALRSHPVLQDRWDVRAVPEGKQGSRLDLRGARPRRMQEGSAGAWPQGDQAVVVTPITTGVKFFGKLYSSRMPAPGPLQNTSIAYQPVGTAVRIQPQSQIVRSRLEVSLPRSEVRQAAPSAATGSSRSRERDEVMRLRPASLLGTRQPARAEVRNEKTFQEWLDGKDNYRDVRLRQQLFLYKALTGSWNRGGPYDDNYSPYHDYHLKLAELFSGRPLTELDAVAKSVLQGFFDTPRHLFAQGFSKENLDFEQLLYTIDRPIKVGHKQTIPKAGLMAFVLMALELKKSDNVLEIGAGTGWLAAWMALLVGHVDAVEKIPELAQLARRNIELSQRSHMVEIIEGDGWFGLPDQKVYDVIVLSADPHAMPDHLLEKLSPNGGRMIVPIDGMLKLFVKNGTEIAERDLMKGYFEDLEHVSEGVQELSKQLWERLADESTRDTAFEELLEKMDRYGRVHDTLAVNLLSSSLGRWISAAYVQRYQPQFQRLLNNPTLLARLVVTHDLLRPKVGEAAKVFLAFFAVNARKDVAMVVREAAIMALKKLTDDFKAPEAAMLQMFFGEDYAQKLQAYQAVSDILKTEERDLASLRKNFSDAALVPPLLAHYWTSRLEQAGAEKGGLRLQQSIVAFLLTLDKKMLLESLLTEMILMGRGREGQVLGQLFFTDLMVPEHASEMLPVLVDLIKMAKPADMPEETHKIRRSYSLSALETLFQKKVVPTPTQVQELLKVVDEEPDFRVSSLAAQVLLKIDDAALLGDKKLLLQVYDMVGRKAWRELFSPERENVLIKDTAAVLYKAAKLSPKSTRADFQNRLENSETAMPAIFLLALPEQLWMEELREYIMRVFESASFEDRAVVRALVHMKEGNFAQHSLTVPEREIHLHDNAISALAFSADGKYLISANKNGKIFRSNAVTGQPEGQFLGLEEPVYALHINSDGSLWIVIRAHEEDAVTKERQPKLKLLHVEHPFEASWKLLAVQTIPLLKGWDEEFLLGNAKALFSADGQLTAYASPNKSGVFIHPTQDTEKMQILKADAIAFYPGKKLLGRGEENDVFFATHLITEDPAKESGVIQIQRFHGDLLDMPVIGRVQAPAAGVQALVFNPNHPDGELLVIDKQGGLYLHNLLNQSSKMILGLTTAQSAVFSPDGRYFATAEKDGRVLVWDAVKGEQLPAFMDHTQPAETLVFSPDSRWLYSASPVNTVERNHKIYWAHGDHLDKTIRVWDVGDVSFRPKEAVSRGAAASTNEYALEMIRAFEERYQQWETDLQKGKRLRSDEDFSKRVNAARRLYQSGKLIPKEIQQAFALLPTLGARQAALMAIYLYRVGLGPYQTLDAVREVLQTLQTLESTAITENDTRFKRGGEHRIALEAHSNIPQKNGDQFVEKSHIVKNLLELAMRVKGNVTATGELRVRALFEDGGLEHQSLPFASPQGLGIYRKLLAELGTAEDFHPFGEHEISYQGTGGYDYRTMWSHFNFNGTLEGDEAFQIILRWLDFNARLARREQDPALLRPGYSKRYIAQEIRAASDSNLETARKYRSEAVGMALVSKKPVPQIPNPYAPVGQNLSHENEGVADFEDLAVLLSEMVLLYQNRTQWKEADIRRWIELTADLPDIAPLSKEVRYHLKVTEKGIDDERVREHEDKLIAFHDLRAGASPAAAAQPSAVVEPLENVIAGVDSVPGPVLPGIGRNIYKAALMRSLAQEGGMVEAIAIKADGIFYLDALRRWVHFGEAPFPSDLRQWLLKRDLTLVVEAPELIVDAVTAEMDFEPLLNPEILARAIPERIKAAEIGAKILIQGEHGGFEGVVINSMPDPDSDTVKPLSIRLTPIDQSTNDGKESRSEVRTARDWNGWAKQRFHATEKAAILQALSAGAKSRLTKSADQRILLNVGAGHGELTAGLAPLFGGGILAVEKDDESVRALSGHGIPNLTIVQGDFFKALQSLTEVRPDLFLMSHSLSLYFPRAERDQLMRQALNLVAPGGQFVLVLNSNDVVQGSNVDIRQRFMKRHHVVLADEKGTMKETLEQMGAAVEIQNLSIPQVTESLDEIMALASALLPPADRTETTLQALRDYVTADFPNGLKHTDAAGKTFYQLTSQQQILWVTPSVRSEVRTLSDVPVPQADSELDERADADASAPQADAKRDVLNLRIMEAVKAWLRSGNVGFQNVPEAMVLRLIAKASRPVAIEELIKTRAHTSVLNKKQRELSVSLSRSLAEVIRQATEGPKSVLGAKSLAAPIPIVAFKKWAEIISNAYLQRRTTGRGDYPFPISALEDYATVFGGLSQLGLKNGGADSFMISGFSQKESGEKRTVGLTVVGQPQNLVETRLLQISGGSSLPVYTGDGIFEKQPDAIIPFMGSFFRQDGTEISPEELQTAGLEWVQDSEGQDLKFPVFASTTSASRVAVMPLPPSSMIVIAEGNEFRILSTKEEFEGFIQQKFGTDPFATIQIETQEMVAQVMSGVSGVMPDLALEDLKKQAYVLAMISFLKKNGYKHAMPIVALRYKGVENHYNFQPAVAREFAEQHDAHQREISSTEQIGRIPEGYTLVTDSRLQGKQGVFLFPYQPGGKTAMGAEGPSILRAIQNDRILFGNGAQLSTINIAAVEVASAEALQRWGGAAGLNPLYAVVQVVTDDTRNLAEVSRLFDLYLTSEIDQNLSVARQQYLENFINFFGPNVAGIIKSNLTFNADDLSVLGDSGMARNISPLGNLRDTGELIPVKRPQESMRVILGMMNTGFFVGKRNGLSAKAWITSPYFDALITAFVEAFEGSDALQQETLSKIQGFKKALTKMDERKPVYQQAFTVAVTRELFEYWTRVKDVRDISEPDREFLAYIAGTGESERRLWEMLAVPASNPLAVMGAVAPAAAAVKSSKKKPGRRSEVRAEAAHRYTPATDDEKTRVLEEIKKSTVQGIVEYGVRFLQGVENSRGALDIGLPTEDAWREAEAEREIVGNYNFSPQRVFPNGLLKDENGIYWIVKKQDITAREADSAVRSTKNDLARERLAFLLTQGLANLTEIRLVNAEQATQSGLPDESSDYYLSRVVTPSNLSVSDLSQQDRAKTSAGLFVANILMRKFDPHPLNAGSSTLEHNFLTVRSFPRRRESIDPPVEPEDDNKLKRTRGDVPAVALDHEGGSSFESYPNEGEGHKNIGFQRFVTDFLMQAIVKTTQQLQPSDPRGLFISDLESLRDVMEMGQEFGAEAIQIMATGFGLGQGYITAEGLTPDNIRQSILDFKTIKNVRGLAEQAGYQGDALEAVTRFIEENQNRLEQDVDFVWEQLTGRKGYFSGSDQARLPWPLADPLAQRRQSVSTSRSSGQMGLSVSSDSRVTLQDPPGPSDLANNQFPQAAVIEPVPAVEVVQDWVFRVGAPALMAEMGETVLRPEYREALQAFQSVFQEKMGGTSQDSPDPARSEVPLIPFELGTPQDSPDSARSEVEESLRRGVQLASRYSTSPATFSAILQQLARTVFQEKFSLEKTSYLLNIYFQEAEELFQARNFSQERRSSKFQDPTRKEAPERWRFRQDFLNYLELVHNLLSNPVDLGELFSGEFPTPLDSADVELRQRQVDILQKLPQGLKTFVRPRLLSHLRQASRIALLTDEAIRNTPLAPPLDSVELDRAMIRARVNLTRQGALPAVMFPLGEALSDKRAELVGRGTVPKFIPLGNGNEDQDYAHYAADLLRQFLERLQKHEKGGSLTAAFQDNMTSLQEDLGRSFTDYFDRGADFWGRPYLMLDDTKAILLFKDGKNGLPYGSAFAGYQIDLTRPLAEQMPADISNDAALLQKFFVPREEYMERFKEEERFYLAMRAAQHGDTMAFYDPVISLNFVVWGLQRTAPNDQLVQAINLSQDVLNEAFRKDDFINKAVQASRQQKLMRRDHYLEWRANFEDLRAKFMAWMPEARLFFQEHKSDLEDFDRKNFAAASTLAGLEAFMQKSPGEDPENLSLASLLMIAAGSLQKFRNVAGADADLRPEETFAMWPSDKAVFAFPEDADFFKLKLKGDGIWLAFILDNAIGGAVRAGEDVTDQKPEIHFAVNKGFLEVTVLDHGPGIPYQNLIRVSDPDFTTKRGETGQAIAFRVIEDVGGTITIDTLMEEQAALLTPQEITDRKAAGLRTEHGLTYHIRWPLQDSSISTRSEVRSDPTGLPTRPSLPPAEAEVRQAAPSAETGSSRSRKRDEVMRLRPASLLGTRQPARAEVRQAALSAETGSSRSRKRDEVIRLRPASLLGTRQPARAEVRQAAPSASLLGTRQPARAEVRVAKKKMSKPSTKKKPVKKAVAAKSAAKKTSDITPAKAKAAAPVAALPRKGVLSEDPMIGGIRRQKYVTQADLQELIKRVYSIEGYAKKTYQTVAELQPGEWMFDLKNKKERRHDVYTLLESISIYVKPIAGDNDLANKKTGKLALWRDTLQELLPAYAVEVFDEVEDQGRYRLQLTWRIQKGTFHGATQVPTKLTYYSLETSNWILTLDQPGLLESNPSELFYTVETSGGTSLGSVRLGLEVGKGPRAVSWMTYSGTIKDKLAEAETQKGKAPLSRNTAQAVEFDAFMQAAIKEERWALKMPGAATADVLNFLLEPATNPRSEVRQAALSAETGSSRSRKRDEVIRLRPASLLGTGQPARAEVRQAAPSASLLGTGQPARAEVRQAAPSASLLGTGQPARAEVRQAAPSASLLGTRQPARAEVRQAAPSASLLGTRQPARAEVPLTPFESETPQDSPNPARSEVRVADTGSGAESRARRRELRDRADQNEDASWAIFETLFDQSKRRVTDRPGALDFYDQFLRVIPEIFKGDPNNTAQALADQGFRAYQAMRVYLEKKEAVVEPLKNSDQPRFEGFSLSRSELMIVTRDRPNLTADITASIPEGVNIERDFVVTREVEGLQKIVVMIFELSAESSGEKKVLGFGALGNVANAIRAKLKSVTDLSQEIVLTGRDSNAQGVFAGSAALLQGFDYGVSDVVYDIFAGLNDSNLSPEQIVKEKVRRTREDTGRFYHVMEDRILPTIEDLPATLGMTQEQVAVALNFVQELEKKVIEEADAHRRSGQSTSYRRSALSRFLKLVGTEGPNSGLPKKVIKQIDKIVLQALKERFFIYDPAQVSGEGQLDLINREIERLDQASEGVLADLEKHAEGPMKALIAAVRGGLLTRIRAQIRSKSVTAEEAVTSTALKVIRKLQRSEWDKERANAADFQTIFSRLILVLRGKGNEVRGKVLRAEESSDMILFVRKANIFDLIERLEEFGDSVKMIVSDDPDATPGSHWVQMADNDFNVPTLLLPPGALDAVWHADVLGESVLVDASEQQVFIRPSPATLARLAQETEMFKAIKTVALGSAAAPAVTQSGVEIAIRASAERPEIIREAMSDGADGVGLVRTEYLIDTKAPEFAAWLSDPTPESRKELIAYFTLRFRDILESVAEHDAQSTQPVTIRAYDFERDKNLGLPNPDKAYGPAFYATPIGRELLKIELLGMLEAGLDYPAFLRILFPAFRNPTDLKNFLARQNPNIMALNQFLKPSFIKTLLQKIAYWVFMKTDALLSRFEIQVLKPWISKMSSARADFSQTLEFSDLNMPDGERHRLNRLSVTNEEQDKLNQQAREDIDLMNQVLDEAYDEMDETHPGARTRLGKVQSGFMIETQEGVNILEHVLDRADFISLGTTDLTISVFRQIEEMSRDRPALAHYFNEIKPEFLEAVRRVLNTVSTWNETKRAKVGVEFCGVMAGVDSFLLALVQDKPKNVSIALNRSPRKIAVTKLFVRQVSDGAETEAEAAPKIEALWQALRASPDVATALQALREPRSEEVAAVENGAGAAGEAPIHVNTTVSSQQTDSVTEIKTYKVNSSKGLHLTPIQLSIAAARKAYPQVKMYFVIDDVDLDVTDIFSMMGLGLAQGKLVQIKLVGPSDQVSALFDTLLTVTDDSTGKDGPDGKTIPGSGELLFSAASAEEVAAFKAAQALTGSVSAIDEGPSSELLKQSIFLEGVTIYREQQENGNDVFTWEQGDNHRRFVVYPSHIAVLQLGEGAPILLQNVLKADDNYLDITLILPDEATRSEVRTDSPVFTAEFVESLIKPIANTSETASIRANFFVNFEHVLKAHKMIYGSTLQDLANFVSPHLKKAHAGMVTHWLKKKIISRENALLAAQYLLKDAYPGEESTKLLARLAGNVELTPDQLAHVFPFVKGRQTPRVARSPTPATVGKLPSPVKQGRIKEGESPVGSAQSPVGAIPSKQTAGKHELPPQREKLGLLAPALPQSGWFYGALLAEVAMGDSAKAARKNFFQNLKNIITVQGLVHGVTLQAIADYVSPHLKKAHSGMIAHWLQEKRISRQNALLAAEYLLKNTYPGEEVEQLLARLVGKSYLTSADLKEIFPVEKGRHKSPRSPTPTTAGRQSSPVKRERVKKGANPVESPRDSGLPSPAKRGRARVGETPPALSADQRQTAILIPGDILKQRALILDKSRDQAPARSELIRKIKEHFLQNAARVAAIKYPPSRGNAPVSYGKIAKAIGVNNWTVKWWFTGMTTKTNAVRPGLFRENAVKLADLLMQGEAPSKPESPQKYAALVALSGWPDLTNDEVEAVFKTRNTKRSEVRSASPSTLKSGLRRNREQGGSENADQLLRTVLFRHSATAPTEQAALAFVKKHNLGRSAFSPAEHAIAKAAGVFFDPRSTIHDPRDVLEAYGRLIRTLLEDSGEDQAKLMKLREIVKRYLGGEAKALAGNPETNYQYLDLTAVEELTEDTAPALAVLSLVRPRGDQVRLYVAGDDDGAVRERIAAVTLEYENILTKLGVSSRANLEMINASGWNNEVIQKDMLNFATGKNGKLQAAILSARADFLSGIQVMKNTQRMDRAKVGRAQALLAAPVLLAAEALDQHTLDILHMRDELERLGLSDLLSARFGQMIAEIKLLAASA